MRPGTLNQGLPVLLSMIVLTFLISTAMAQVYLPVITNTQIDLMSKRLVINGSAFGSLYRRTPTDAIAGHSLLLGRAASLTDRRLAPAHAPPEPGPRRTRAYIVNLVVIAGHRDRQT